MNTFVAVFTQLDPDNAKVFWGAFPNYPDATTAVEQYVADHPYWLFTEFSIEEFPFGVLL